MNAKLLGLKRKYENLDLSSSSSSNSDNDNQYKDSFKVKLDSNKQSTVDSTKSKEKPKEAVKSIVKSAANSSLLAILPPPTKKLTDKAPKLLSEDNTPSSLKTLINPDSVIASNSHNTQQNAQSSEQEMDSNMLELNQKDLVDKDWERKYVDKLHQFELNKRTAVPSKTINEHHIKNVIEEYNQAKAEAEAEKPVKSRYGKISTKAKYGW